jgi:hypothetical protein
MRPHRVTATAQNELRHRQDIRPCRCHHANRNWIGQESMNWHFYRSYSLLTVSASADCELKGGLMRR